MALKTEIFLHLLAFVKSINTFALAELEMKSVSTANRNSVPCLLQNKLISDYEIKNNTHPLDSRKKLCKRDFRN